MRMAPCLARSKRNCVARLHDGPMILEPMFDAQRSDSALQRLDCFGKGVRFPTKSTGNCIWIRTLSGTICPLISLESFCRCRTNIPASPSQRLDYGWSNGNSDRYPYEDEESLVYPISDDNFGPQ